MFPIVEVRSRFPAIEAARGFVFFDNAAGAQVPRRVIETVLHHLLAHNVQRGGPYQRSREVDAMIAGARAHLARFVNARSADEIAFGLNATSFMRAISLAIGQTLDPRIAGRTPDRNEVVVSEADHEANIASWLALERVGARIVWWRVREDGRLHPEDLAAIVGPRTRIVACTVATNATGSIVDVAAVGRIAHAAGAEVFLDAVHYAPHGPVDVRQWDCDYLVCSGYKIFAPHMGFAWCRREAINALPTFREDFIPDTTPDKLEAGTYGYESVAGMDAAISYLEEWGDREGPCEETICRAMNGIAEYERALSAAMLDAVESIPGAKVYGVTDRSRLHERVPTIAFTVDGVPASAIADRLAAQDIGVRSGHMYSPRLIARLGAADHAVVRASLVHYNTLDEVARFREVLRSVLSLA